ncbi:MAG: AAA family ATPase [SAR324 cluster bacterium]|nr:AAA family ATPase [SAR324 cluster bacterium]
MFWFCNLDPLHCFFQDRKHFIEVLKNEPERYIFFLRPRRFGKSLFVSMLKNYRY